MFDIGFWELAVIGVIALLVLGPERLPRAARTAGLLISRARRTVTTMKMEIEKELDLAELERLKKDSQLSELREEITEVIDQTAAVINNPLNQHTVKPSTASTASVPSEQDIENHAGPGPRPE